MHHPKPIILFETLGQFISLSLLVSHYKPVCHIVCPKMSTKLDFPGIKGKQKKTVYEDITFYVYFNTAFSKNLKQIKFL